MQENMGFIKNLESVHGNEVSNGEWKLIQKIMRRQTSVNNNLLYLYDINILLFKRYRYGKKMDRRRKGRSVRENEGTVEATEHKAQGKRGLENTARERRMHSQHRADGFT